MDFVFIFGNNKISKFLKSSLKSFGCLGVDHESRLKNPILAKPLAILDLADAAEPYPPDSLQDVKYLIDLAVKKSAPYIFVFKEGNNPERELSLINAIDFIHQYAKLMECRYAIVQIDDIYGKNINTNPILISYLKLLIKGKPWLDISSDLNDIYLLHENDLTKGIINIINETASGLSHCNYNLLPEEPITETELAHFISDLADLELIIRHVSDEPLLQEFKLLEIETVYPAGWKPEVTLESGLLELFENIGIPTPRSANEEKSRVKHIHIKIPVKAKIMVLTTILFASLLIPSAKFMKNLLFGFKYLKQSVQNLQNLDITLASENSQKAQEYLAKTRSLPLGIYLISIPAGIGTEDFSAIADTAVNINELAVGLSETTLNAIIESKTLALNKSAVLGTSTQLNPKNAFNRSIELADVSINNLKIIDQKIPFVKDQLTSISQVLQDSRNKLADMKNINPVLSEILGFQNPRKYLLLFQNSNELRASGGSIVFYGLIEADKGEIKVLRIDDTGSLDEQLELNSINIPPPLPVRKVLGQNQMNIKDAGWDPDFTENAKKISYLYKTASGENVDGIITVNLSFIKSLIGNKADTNTDSPSKLVSSFFKKTSDKNIDYHELIQSIYAGLSSKEILVYDSHESVLSSVLKNNWAGAIQTKSDDYLYVLDSNIGGNDANRHVSRSIQYDGFKPQKDSGYVRKVYIIYTNTIPENGGAKEDYLNYLRVIVPGDSRLNYAKITTNGKEKNITPEVEISSYATQAVYSIELLVPAGKTNMVTLEYESLDKDFAQQGIELLVQKQPGIENNPVKATFSYPTWTNKSPIPAGAVLSHGTITYSSMLNGDKRFEFPL